MIPTYGRCDRPVFLILIICVGVLVGCSTGRKSNVSVDRAPSESIQLTKEKGPVTMQVRLWPKEPRLSDLVELDIVVGAEAEVVIRSPDFGGAVGDFLVRDYVERSPKKSSEPDKPNRRVFHYQLEPVHTGVHLIRSVAIEFIDNRENSEQKGQSTWIESDPIEVKITSELGDQVPSLANLEPMAPPKTIDEPIRWWWLAAGLLLVVAVGAFFLNRRSRVSNVVAYQPTAEEIAHLQLESLLAEDLPSRGMFKDFYLRLTGIVRIYIEGVTGLRAPEQTTEEFLHAMGTQHVFATAQSHRLKDFLEAADLVKYAGQQPDSSEVETSIVRAKEFIDMKPLESENVTAVSVAGNVHEETLRSRKGV